MLAEIGRPEICIFPLPFVCPLFACFIAYRPLFTHQPPPSPSHQRLGRTIIFTSVASLSQSLQPSNRPNPSEPTDRSDMPTPGPKKRKQNAGDDADNQELARLPKKGAALAEQIKSICGKYPWEIAEGFEPLTWGINLLEDFRALINLARGTVTITQVRNELQRLAGLHERSDRVNKLMKADIVATKTWVAEKIEHAETRSPEHSNKDEGEDGFSSPGEDTVADDTLSGDKSVTSTANLETGLMDEGDKECEEAHEEHQARPNGEHVGQHVDKNVDQALGPQTPVQSINDSDTTQSREKQANTGMVTTRKHSLPPISPTAPKRQKTANVYLGSGLQTTPEDEQVCASFNASNTY